MQISEILFITVSQLFALAPGAIAFALSYALGWFPNLDERISNGIKVVATATALALVGYVATLLPDSFMQLKVIDAVLMVLGGLAASVGGIKFGAVYAKTQALEHKVRQLDAKYDIDTYAEAANKSAQIVALFIVFLGLIAAFGFAPVASAEAPQPYTYALMQCSGLGVNDLAIAQQKFDSAYGWRYQLRTDAQWAGTYEARVNAFAATLGCAPVLRDGQLTYAAKIYVPVWGFYFGEYPNPF